MHFENDIYNNTYIYIYYIIYLYIELYIIWYIILPPPPSQQKVHSFLWFVLTKEQMQKKKVMKVASWKNLDTTVVGGLSQLVRG